ncbi:At2g23090 like protein [Camillea tinctor]|nr:At2g23090 like protein [Camillea tinctor]
MGGGNGCKSSKKRERNQKEAAKAPKSQLKSNVKAMDIQCQVCKATFLKTTRAPELTTHALNKHSRDLAACFPTFEA